jgi:hypothetical protein
MSAITSWVAVKIFGDASPLVYRGNSRDTNFFWAEAVWVPIAALLAAGIWSVLDRRREQYTNLHKWFRLFMRFGVAAQMFYFGVAKVIPTQFPAPSLITLSTRVGDVPLHGLFWTTIGMSPVYEMFLGWVEVLGGLLLLTPGTAMLGALVSMAGMVQVFLLNMTYDIGVKLVSFHLVLMSLFLLAPDLPRLSAFLRNRPVAPSTEPPLFQSRTANRVALMLQIAFGIYLLGVYTSIGSIWWRMDGSGEPVRSPLYGIWTVERLAINGRVRPPDLNDYDRRWRRVIFDSPDRVAFQRTDDSFARYRVSIDASSHTLQLNKEDSRSWQSRFVFQRPAADRLILEGEMDGLQIRAELGLVEFDTFRLLNSRFRLVRPPDTD